MTAGAPRARRGVRLQKYLSRAGVASRREGEGLIREGRVSVDGSVVTELGARVVPGEQEVKVDGRRVEPRPARWLALYKPAGYLTARKDTHARPTVYALLPANCQDLFHVGRLDRLTEGLLIFTNQGEAAHRLLHPSSEVRRRYRAELKGEAGPAEARRLERGVALEDGVARAEDVRVRPGRRERGGRPTTTVIQLTLREGRKREVRRMLEGLGLTVTRLVRVSFGPIELEGLAPGEWRELTAQEVEALHAAVGLRGSSGDS